MFKIKLRYFIEEMIWLDNELRTQMQHDVNECQYE